MNDYDVVAGAGTLHSASADAVHFPHGWTPGGVTVESAFTGAHLLHVAVAGCVLNDTYREAERLGVALSGVRVRASGAFDTDVWTSIGICYSIEIDSNAPGHDVDAVVRAVDAVAEIPKAIRAGASVARVPIPDPVDVQRDLHGHGAVGRQQPSLSDASAHLAVVPAREAMTELPRSHRTSA